ncbi:LysR family transcriptional regulator [Arenicella xantha]|uniref:LysR family carnitine catabolism transcriptional activator n=1 Tax=Arenicella xantha TaxID=644221 RepID=A0A395JFS8_9GAMM|nr:LysR family transcriptional regulator [Arenicella xantha]RBP47196.1 LysR family carnitine catabolism transcriptional activator [Arenicella xantha]
MNISINQIIAFSTIARIGSFAEAAIHLHLSQPTLSIAIKNLEQTLGGKLFARTTRSVTLTPEGKAFYPVAKRLLEDWERSLQDVRNHFELLRGKLELAAMPTYTINRLPAILRDFHTQHPAINITVHDVIAEKVVDMVREGRCELGITFEPPYAQDLDFEPLYTDRFVALLPAKHQLLAKKRLRWVDILTYPHISLSRPASTRTLIDQALMEQELLVTPVLETQQLVSIGRMVNAGLGVSVVPSTSRTQMEEMGLHCRAISSPVITHKLGILTRRQHELSAAAQAMKSLIQQTNSVAKNKEPPAL